MSQEYPDDGSQDPQGQQPNYGGQTPPQGGYPQPEQPGQYGQPGGFNGPPQAPQFGGNFYALPQVQPFSVGAALKYGWNAVFKAAGFWIVLALLAAIASLIIGLLNPSFWDTLEVASRGYAVPTGFSLMGLIAVVVSGVLQGVVSAVYSHGGLKQTAGGQPTLADSLKLPNVQNVLIWSVVWALVYGVLSRLATGLTVIAIVLGFVTMFTFPFLVERNMQWLDAVKASVQLVTGHLGVLLLFGLALIGVNLVGALLCGIGLLVTLPMSSAAVVYTYRSLNNQPIAPVA